MAQLQGVEARDHAGPAALAAARRAAARRRRFGALGRHVALAVVGLLFAAPFFWMITSALKDNGLVFADPIVWWPTPALWGNYGDVLTDPQFPFVLYLKNSVFYAGAITVGTVLSCAAVGYGFARLRFPGRDLLFGLTLATMMIPGIVTFIPTYVLFRFLHLSGTYAPLVIPGFLGNAFFIFMVRQFFMGLPWELSDAAKVDGAGEWLIFWRIMLPLVRSALIVVAVFTFLYTWNDYFGPLIFVSDPGQYPLSLGLFTFKAQRTTDWDHLMAASAVSTLPLIALFFATQRYFLQGITITGLKG